MGHGGRLWQVHSTYLNKRRGERKGKYRKEERKERKENIEKEMRKKLDDKGCASTLQSRATMGPYLLSKLNAPGLSAKK